MQYFVYILSSFNNNVLYTGRTENLAERVSQHKNKLADSFTKKYNVTKLVYYEIHKDAEEAAKREWKIKKWKREWKENLINQSNVNWDDLYDDFLCKIV